MAQAIEAAGAEIVTVALRRVDIANKDDDMLSAIDREKYLLLPNTSGARTADEAIRLSRLARAATGINWVKLEVTPDPYYLLPDPIETLKAAEILERRFHRFAVYQRGPDIEQETSGCRHSNRDAFGQPHRLEPGVKNTGRD